MNLESISDQGYYLDLRYSPTCYAAWVRVTSEGFWNPVANFWIERDNGWKYSNFIGGGQEVTKWTAMMSYSYTIRGCMKLSNSSNGHVVTYCTGWH